MLAKVENLSKYDLDLAQRVESAYEELLNCDLVSPDLFHAFTYFSFLCTKG